MTNDAALQLLEQWGFHATHYSNEALELQEKIPAPDALHAAGIQVGTLRSASRVNIRLLPAYPNVGYWSIEVDGCPAPLAVSPEPTCGGEVITATSFVGVIEAAKPKVEARLQRLSAHVQKMRAITQILTTSYPLAP
jgi:hypothetical protein